MMLFYNLEKKNKKRFVGFKLDYTFATPNKNKAYLVSIVLITNYK